MERDNFECLILRGRFWSPRRLLQDSESLFIWHMRSFIKHSCGAEAQHFSQVLSEETSYHSDMAAAHETTSLFNTDRGPILVYSFAVFNQTSSFGHSEKNWHRTSPLSSKELGCFVVVVLLISFSI